MDEEARSTSRTNICLVAMLIVNARSMPVRIRNLSPSGALIDGTALPPAGAEVELSRGRGSLVGEVVWSENGRCGIRFADRITVADWLASGVGNHNQIRINNIVAEIPKGGSVASARQPTQSKPIDVGLLDQRLADEVAYAARQLEVLKGDMAQEPLLLARHSVGMKTLDIVTEILDRVAAALRAGHATDLDGTERTNKSGRQALALKRRCCKDQVTVCRC
jgi:hypothetical protein